jgi:hypothetical protein
MRRILLLAILVLITGGLSAVAFSQEPKGIPEEKARQSTRYSEALPMPRAAAEVVFRDGDRELKTVLIHPEDNTSTSHVPGRYYHKPLWAMVERTKPIDAFPAIVRDVDRTSAEDGTVFLSFRVKLSTRQLRTQCRDAVLDQDRLHALADGRTEDQIVIRPWPLKHAVITCLNVTTREVLSVCETGTLTGKTEDLEFAMPFIPADLRKFQGAARGGKLAFVYTYTYAGRQVYKGEVTVTGQKNIKLLAGEVLSSAQLEGKAPIFQTQKNEVSRLAAVSLQKTVVVQNKDLLPLLDTTDMASRLFAPENDLTQADLAKDSGAAKNVEAYLLPQLDKLQEATGNKDIKVATKEELQTLNLLPADGFSFGIISVHRDEPFLVRSSLDRVEHTTGTSYQRIKETNYYRPHSIKVWKFRSGIDELNFNEKNTVFLAVGQENMYLEDTEVLAAFTLAVAEKGIAARQEHDAYNGVRLGAMVPYFAAGEKPPKGYVFADGKSLWPKRPWVPDHLQGKPVPNMDGYLIGGAPNLASVGEPWNKGKIKGTTVTGGSFKIPTGSHRIQGDGCVFAWNGPRVGGKMLPPKNINVAGKNGPAPDYGGFWAWKEATLTIPSGSVTGDFVISDTPLNTSETNPRHYMCRWIIRVE